MPCKIADGSSAVQPVLWQSLSTANLPQRSSTAAGSQPRNDDSTVRQQLAEYEKMRQAELAQARQSALQEGVSKGREEAAQQVKEATDRLARMAKDLQQWKSKLRSDAESDVVKLSLAIARRILHRELSIDPESLQGIVHAALQQLQNREISTIRTCSAAVEAVKSALHRLGVSQSVTVAADPEMRAGDITFETSLGTLDVSVDVQLREIERGFADRLGLK